MTPPTRTATTTLPQSRQTNTPTHRRRGPTLIPPALTIALWRLKRMWRLLLMAELGMLTAVTLVCAVPLFTQVSTAAGIQEALSHGDITSQTIEAELFTSQPTPAIVAAAQQRLTTIIAASPALRAMRPGASSFQMTSTTFKLAPSTPSALILRALTNATFTQQLATVEGRFPQPITSNQANPQLEVTLTQTAATSLGVHVGSSILLPTQPGSQALPLTLHVVGVIRVLPSAARDGDNFQPLQQKLPDGQPPAITYQAITTTDAVLASTYDWTSLSPLYPSPDPNASNQWYLNWSYPVDLSHLSPADVRALLNDPQGQSNALFNAFQNVPGANGNGHNGFLYSYVLQQLANYKMRVIGSIIIVTILLLDALGLMLLFQNLMSGILVDRQLALIALLRSRGASRRQIIFSFANQSILLGALAFLLGPLLAIPLTRFIAHTLLPVSQQSALSVLDGNPLSLANGSLIFAAIPTIIAIAAMIWTTARATRLNALTQRQETTRATHKPLWRRLYLDVAFAVLALAGYTVYTIAITLSSQTSGSRVAFILSPLALIAPMFLLLASAMLILRFLPFILRLGERLAARGRGVPALLAFTQLARASRSATRIILLLALTTCFALFTFNANTTIAHYIQDAAAYQAGADLSGGLTTDGHTINDLASETATYRAIPGVIAASLGYRSNSGQPPNMNSGSNGAIQGNGPSQLGFSGVPNIIAVDTDTFASVAYWPQQDTAQPLHPLLAALHGRRADATQHDTVYAAVDATVWDELKLSPGATFALPQPGYPAGVTMSFTALTKIPYIPTLYADQQGGLLVDYQSYATVYAHDTGDTTGAALAPNFAWLRTKNDQASLASVRAAINTGPLKFSTLLSPGGAIYQPTDRRQLATNLNSDPLYINTVGVLNLGATTALLLALFGALIAAWLNTRNQQTTFALLRALGLTPRRIITLLVWEQGAIYLGALLLGMALAAMLTFVTLPELPNLLFSSSVGGPIDSGGAPVLLAWPWPTLALALGALALICGVACLISARNASRPSLSQTLRLNAE